MGSLPNSRHIGGVLNRHSHLWPAAFGYTPKASRSSLGPQDAFRRTHEKGQRISV